MDELVLEMKNITKTFGSVSANRDVSLKVYAGEIHALLGENGAGKSTLMNVLTGIYRPDSGQILCHGKEVTISSPKDAVDLGIGMVHQHFRLIPTLTVAENISLYTEKKGFLLNPAKMQKRIAECSRNFNLEVDPAAVVWQLSVGEQQRVEIVKLLYHGAEILILDEPSAVLTPQEAQDMFNVLRKMADSGKAVIVISHKMNEIFTIADRYTVLRNGCFIQSGNIADTTPEAVTRLMVGSSYSDASVYQTRQLGDVALKLEHLSGEGFENVDLEVRKGEIIGLTGLKGAGVSEMMQAIFGAIPISSGTVYVNGEPLHHGGIHNAMRHKIGMIPANRKENSVIPDFTLLENNYISEHTLSANHQLIRGRKEVAQYNRMRDMLNIKANSHDDLILSLSGGNQQKVILGRWLTTEADILIMDNPTQGIDVGAKAEIYKLILELAEKGKTILVNTLEIPEIQKIADRCVVFYHGNIQTILPREEITEERVMLYATNVIHATEGEVNV